MIIRKVFGSNSTYISTLAGNIHVAIAVGKNNWSKSLSRIIALYDTMIEDIKIEMEEAKSRPPILIQNPISSNKVFIVHGHNNNMKESVARLIEKMQLGP